uniref:Short neuropeptide F n=1 Tax=Steinernema glaseri TaxID=37863 RepID=A0A1I7YHB6_9BILA
MYVRMLNTVALLFIALVLVAKCSPIPEENDSYDQYLMKRDQLLRSIYQLRADSPYVSSFMRASRSNGKPTFIRFGKRSGSNVDPYDPRA